MIAHRLETVLMAERVFCLNDGKLEEISPSSLMGGQHDSSGVVSSDMVVL